MWELELKHAREWGGGGGSATERHEGINRTKGATEKFEQKEDACGMVKRFAISMPFIQMPEETEKEGVEG